MTVNLQNKPKNHTKQLQIHKSEATASIETSVSVYQSTPRQMPEDFNLLAPELFF